MNYVVVWYEQDGTVHVVGSPTGRALSYSGAQKIERTLIDNGQADVGDVSIYLIETSNA